ncbi:MAG: hypothetical protein PHU85_07030 [Phycisphaerae bacterium]|nr:hypothetical protein [Phycisphaerae bacterium]
MATHQRNTSRHRGSVYLLVLGLAVVLTLIGVATLTAGRVGMRAMTDSQDWVESQSLASAAAEHAMLQVSRDANWRTTYNNQTVTKSLGRGTFTWRLTDETDNNLTDTPTDPFVILATGTVGRASYAMRVHMSSSSTNVLTSGVTVSTLVRLSSNATVDSYDSSLGDYGGSNVGSAAMVRTNSTASGTVALSSNARINGSVQVGPNGNPNQVVSMSSGATVTGTKTAMSQAMTMPTVSAPTGLGASTGNLTYNNNQTALVSGNLHVDNLSLKSNSKVRINGNVTIWAEGNFSVASNAYIEVLSGSSLTLYVNGSMAISSNGAVRNNTAKVSNAKFIGLGSNPVSISANGSLEGVIIAPNASVTLSSNAQLFGAVMAKDMTLSSNADFHEDRNITNQVDRVLVGSGSSNPKPDGWGRVVQ